MRLVAIKTFRPKNMKGTSFHRGQVFQTDDASGREYIRAGLAIEEKMLPEHENKMLKDFENKGMPVESQSAEERSQGITGPTDESQTVEERNQGKNDPGRTRRSSATAKSSQTEQNTATEADKQ